MSQDGPGDGDASAPVPSAPTEGLPEGFLAPGQVLGDRYQIKSQLGRGGMGEVWRAFDLKLRVEVALKALREDLFKDETRLEFLRREVRAARDVLSPNVCRIFDLIEVDGQELVSMEYVDGGTLLDLLAEGGPLDLKQAQDIASQFLAGLEAIHQVGLVHRDVKPENIMITRAGRVVLMDFGLARQEDSGAGTVSGTPAYMAPEQAAGLKVDARADVFSAGVVLAEMVSPDGIKSFESRQSIWEGVRSEPVKMPDSPWAPVLKKAVAREPDQRHNSAHTLIRELEDVTLRVEGAEDLTPYPGLASFTEEDAEYFFGREAEVEQMWQKLEGAARLLAVVGPSGAGKTSFLRAGLVPSTPSGWGVVRCTPGTAPFVLLGQAVAADMAGDTEAMGLMIRFEDIDVAVEVISRWRERHQHALLVVDQFEELFTLNSFEEQERFATLLGRLALEADVHVLLSMRDDFFVHCNSHEPLRGVFHELTVLDPPTGQALRRALVQPATKCGYRFEDDDLVDEMLAEVQGERGTLPLLAFAVSQLWEQRDREHGVLTRKAYRDIGGVGGALARHAEATIDRIGPERIAHVRELFRNLVTPEGMRAVREWNELLSVFEGDTTKKPFVGAGFIPAREAAEEVLRELIDARLLTSYEIQEEDQQPTRSVEIIHESLLANWPRLTRWQTQDADSAQLREQVRQAARTWDEHNRTDDLLWSGSTYREFALWRERYPGGLTETEQAFAQAMTSFATRRRRRRRLVTAAAFVVLLAVLAIVGSLWQRSEKETRRAEAQKLLALGQLELEIDPTAALAWARASLEVFDTREGRRFALRALANGPIARVLPLEVTGRAATFSPDGEWLAFEGFEKFLVYRRSGGPAVFKDAFQPRGRERVWPFFDETSRRLQVVGMGEVRSYAVPGFEEISRDRLPYASSDQELVEVAPTDRGTLLALFGGDAPEFKLLRSGSPPEHVLNAERILFFNFESAGEWVAYFSRGQMRDVYLQSLVDATLPPRHVHTHDESIADFSLHPDLEFIAIRGRESGEISLWPLDPEATEPIRSFDSRGLPNLRVFSRGPRVVSQGMYEGNPSAFVWDLRLPPEAEPLMLRSRVGTGVAFGISSDPDGRWFVGLSGEAVFWPYPESQTMVFPDAGGGIGQLTFTPDGKNLVIPQFPRRGLRIQPLVGGEVSRTLMKRWTCAMAEMDPQGRFAVVSAATPEVFVCPLDGSEPTYLEGFDGSAYVAPVAYDPERELVAGGCLRGPADQKVVRVWNLRDGSVQVLGPTKGVGDMFEGGYMGLEFLPDGSLLSLNNGQIRRWRLEDGSSELLYEGCERMGVPADGRTVVVSNEGGVIKVLDLTTNEVHQVEGFQVEMTAGTLSPDGNLIAAGTAEGVVMIRRFSGGEPHLLFGHDAPITSMSFSPDARRLATIDRGGTVRVWPVPDMSRTPIHALPQPELLAKLDEITNFRVVRDEESPTGWKTEIGPFPGWETVPIW